MAMFVGVCSVQLRLYGVESLKDKRSVVRRVIRRTQDRFRIAMNEVGHLDDLERSEIGIAVIGNDAAWTQIARDQITLLGDDVATNLARTDYNVVAAGLGAVGLVIKDESEIDEVLARARTEAAAGRPVLINAHIGTTRFRDGSISV